MQQLNTRTKIIKFSSDIASRTKKCFGAKTNVQKFTFYIAVTITAMFHLTKIQPRDLLKKQMLCLRRLKVERPEREVGAQPGHGNFLIWAFSVCAAPKGIMFLTNCFRLKQGIDFGQLGLKQDTLVFKGYVLL